MIATDLSPVSCSGWVAITVHCLDATNAGYLRVGSVVGHSVLRALNILTITASEKTSEGSTPTSEEWKA